MTPEEFRKEADRQIESDFIRFTVELILLFIGGLIVAGL
jgi:hypothetical protein